jgi:hypothetical protein
MPTSLLALFVTLCSILRSRVNLQVENLALRHGCCWFLDNSAVMTFWEPQSEARISRERGY